MKKRNRILAILLTAIMTFSMLPSEAFATEAIDTGDTAAAAVEEATTSVGEEQDVETTVEEISTVEEAAEEISDPAEAEEVVTEETVTEEAVTEEAAEPAADQEDEDASEEAADPAEAEEIAEPAVEAVVETAETVEWPITLEAKGSDYTVTATFDESAGFPADVKLNVSEISKGSDAYQSYYDQALETVQNETDKEVKLTDARFFDITFYTEEGEVEPTGPVNVSIKYRKSIDVESKDDIHVLHFDDNEEAAPAIMDIETSGRGDMVNEVSFETDGFSVYAVIGTDEAGDNARATVNFCQADGTVIETMIVKNSDTLAELEKILYDPGAGTLEDGYAFYGWTFDKDYAVDDASTALTIAQVRADIDGRTFKEGDVVNVYAMTFAHYTVEYLDPTGTVSVGSASTIVKNKGDEAPFKISESYQTDDKHNFEGWLVTKGLDNITNPSGITADTLIGGPTEITDLVITGDLTLEASAPEGNWLVFDENGKGATYNAPRFFETNEQTNDDGLIEMARNGYTFEGWYTDQACTSGNEFSFGGYLTEKTTIYAKWTPIANANYTVLIWKQNLAADGYDFAEAVSLTGTVGSTVSTVSRQGTGNDAYARIDGTNYQYTGFHLNNFDQNVEIKPEGNAVVNVYYDRTEYTLTFQVRSGWSWTTIKTITALYEQNIGDNFPIEGHETSRWDPQNGSTYNQVLIYIDVMPAENVTFHEDTSTASQKHIYFYVEALEGDQVDRRYNGKDFTLYKSLDPNYNFFTEAEDYIDLVGFNKGGNTYPPQAYRYNNGGTYSGQQSSVWNNGNANYVLCYYTRQLYGINFMDGVYVDGNNNPVSGYESRGQLRLDENIIYGADISSYNKDGENYYAPTYDGFVFEGWYIDSACTQAYTFTNMPDGGITVYAKWRQVQYRVFLHPNAYDEDGNKDDTLDWGSESQAMNFRVSYDGEVSTPKGRRRGYEFYGWYFDEGLSTAYPEAFKLHGKTGANGEYFSDYDKTTDFTDPMDKWGEGATTNSDITGWDGKDRYWITEKLDLYARWSMITVGADGINVAYDAGGDGTDAPVDTLTYKDNSSAVAGASSKPTDTNKVFKQWIVQKWDGTKYSDTETTVLPGGTFTIHATDARIVDKNTGNDVALADVDEDGSYTYTVQLRAEYADTEESTPTHIPWFKNNGTEAFHIDIVQDGQGAANSTLEINQAVDVQGKLERGVNYTFLGWARVEMTGDPADWETNDANWTQNLTADNLFLYYNKDDGKFYSESTFTNEVSSVAADESTPYHAMFAVWDKIPGYFVKHSSGGDPVFYKMPAAGETVDLTGLVETGYLYGGYYHYDEVDGQRTKGDAYTSNGKKLTPTDGTYYYLKEVDEGHLRPKLYLIHNELHDDLIQGLYGIVSIDENAYSECGFIIEGTRYEADLAEAGIQVTKEGQEEPVTTITGADFGFDGCPVGLADFTDLIAGDTRIDIKGYYITPDSVVVTGNRIRRIQFPAGDKSYGGMPLFTGWGSAAGQTRTGLVKSTSETTYEAGSSNAANMNAVRMLRISAPSDKIEYRITKIYDSGTEEQMVEGGNNAGNITYAPKSGYMFAGWYQDADYTIPADFANVTGDMTVYAEYIKNKDVTLAFKRTGTKNNVTTFTVTVTVKKEVHLEDVKVTVVGGNTAILGNRTVKQSGTGNNVKYTTEYKGTISVVGLSKVDKFTSFVSWDTLDGTVVKGADKKCTYQLGNVIVR